MRIERIEVTNFKSFDEIKAELGKLNIIIGANASGKSNFVNIFKFLKDIFTIGLDNAIAMQGGVECIRNMNIGSSKDLRIAITTESPDNASRIPENRFDIKHAGRKISCGFVLREIVYEFTLEFYKRKIGYVVGGERLEIGLDLVEVKKENGKLQRGEKIENCRVKITLNKIGKLRFASEPEKFPASLNRIFPFMEAVESGALKLRFSRHRKGLHLLATPFGDIITPSNLALFSRYSSNLLTFLRKMALFDIDPKLSKRSTLITGKPGLNSDGSNLAVVLKKILGSKKNRKRISNLMKDLLPFIEDLNVEKLADRSLLAYSKEVYCGKKYLPAPLLSDGTINLTALIIALYFERNPLVVIEEPERNIHPRLISRLMDMIKDVSQKTEKQIVITTHNPEVVKHAGIENLFLIRRNEHFSTISKPAGEKMVRNFLKKEIGVDELFVKNLLGG